MAFEYTFSSSFDILKKTEEVLDENYTTRDYVSAMEKLIHNAVEPIVHTSKYAENYLSSVAAWYAGNSKRKITKLPKSQFFGLLAHTLITNSTQIKIQKIKTMQLERTILFYLVNDWLRSLNGYTGMINQSALTRNLSNIKHLRKMEYTVGKRMNLSSSQSLYSGIRASKFWIAEFVKLKELILQKYYRFIINTAQSDFKSLGHTVSLDDMAQNYVLVSSKALDKCDYEQGTLTSYLQLWLKSAKHKITKKGSISNTVSSFISDGTSSESNYVRLDDASLLDKDELVQEERIDDHITHVRLLLKEMDPTGIIRLSMGIEEILNKEELAILETSC